jgi:hypothetical protein
MPKGPVQIFWRGRNAAECVLRSTDHGWEVAVIGVDGQPLRQQRVSSNDTARAVAERWRREEEPNE